MSMIELDIDLDPGLANRTLWVRQLWAIMRVEIRKSLLSKRALPAYGLTFIPIILLLVMGLVENDFGEPITGNIDRARRAYAFIYSGFILGAVVFLGSAAIFTTLFRGEMLDRSMHYYLLSPVRRELLATGKYLAGLISAFSLFGMTTIVCYVLLYLPYGFTQLMVDITSGIAVSQIFSYLGVTLMGCIGYGALFLLMGLLFRNPLIPVAVVAGWEVIHFALPPALKALSIVHYLKGLVPIPSDVGQLAIIIAPPPFWVSITGLLSLSTVSLVAAVFFLKRIEIRYTED